jgi:D-alanyl-lipoteichoic acid acyltransferase DltB (MBOAT superfamily)
VQSHVAGFDGRLEEVRGRSPPATIWAPDIILDLNCLATSGKSRGAVVLFNSAVFCFVFLPATLAGYYIFNGCGLGRWAIAWLVFASAVFYGWFSVPYLGMLAVLILFNYAMGVVLSRDFRAKRQRPALLIAGIAVNVAALGYFKYAGFFVGNANVLFGSDFLLQKIVLPIGISFFTFQKIAYLVDAYQGKAEEYDLLDFSLFVMYFPQLIAGPIVHHKEIIPQFRRCVGRHFRVEDLATGVALFTFGLIKKVVIADTLVDWSDPVFATAHAGQIPTLYKTWTAVLSFTLQIYFDFSGYTDMALGLAAMISIRLPLNFDSPYKATSIIEFWRCWHMTLSRFLRDYVYIPLGGNRCGSTRRLVNLMLTMLIGGLWHGAAWTFIAWGGLHGLYLVINHAWRHVSGKWSLPWRGTAAGRWTARLITFLAVAFAWVFFRSEDFATATTLLRGMGGLGGLGLPTKIFAFVTPGPAGALALLLVGVFLLPNSQQLLAGLHPALQAVNPAALGRLLRDLVVGRPIFAQDGSISLNATTGLAFAAMFMAAMLLQLLRTASVQPFIYFQF